jgi:hypothetical protein
MRMLLISLWIAGFIQLGIVCANFYLPGKLQYRKRLAGVAPIIRQVFFVHASYVAAIVLLFVLLTLGFPHDLASGRGLGRFLAAAMCLFWLLRVPLQMFYYDAEVRRANRAGDLAMMFAVLFLTVTYGAAACLPR